MPSLQERAARFYLRARERYGDRYQYPVPYVSSTTHMRITCSRHGDFIQTPDEHLRRQHGCPQCSYLATATQQNEKAWARFLEIAPTLHDNSYDYSKCTYKGMHDKIELVCRIHGTFQVSPTHHISMRVGCQKCGVMRRSIYRDSYFKRQPDKCNLPALTYMIMMSDEHEQFLKIGITQEHALHLRLKAYRNTQYTPTLLSVRAGTLYQSFGLEQSILTTYREYQYYPNHSFVGYTECLDSNDATNNGIRLMLNT